MRAKSRPLIKKIEWDKAEVQTTKIGKVWCYAEVC